MNLHVAATIRNPMDTEKNRRIWCAIYQFQFEYVMCTGLHMDYAPLSHLPISESEWSLMPDSFAKTTVPNIWATTLALYPITLAVFSGSSHTASKQLETILPTLPPLANDPPTLYLHLLYHTTLIQSYEHSLQSGVQIEAVSKSLGVVQQLVQLISEFCAHLPLSPVVDILLRASIRVQSKMGCITGSLPILSYSKPVLHNNRMLW